MAERNDLTVRLFGERDPQKGRKARLFGETPLPKETRGLPKKTDPSPKRRALPPKRREVRPKRAASAPRGRTFGTTYRNVRKNQSNTFLTVGVSFPRRQVSAAFFTTSPWVG